MGRKVKRQQRIVKKITDAIERGVVLRYRHQQSILSLQAKEEQLAILRREVEGERLVLGEAFSIELDRLIYDLQSEDWRQR